MTRNPVNSSQLRSMGYNPATSVLEIEFHPTKPRKDADPNDPPGEPSVYEYYGVSPEVYEQLQAAESTGSAFYRLIKGGDYKYKKLA